MVKKIIFITILMILIGCSNSSFKTIALTPKEQLLEKNMNVWKLDQSKKILSQLKPSLTPIKYKKYKNLIQKKENNIRSLSALLETLKSAISKNQIFIVKKYSSKGLITNIKLNQLKKLDLSGANIYNSKPKFNKNSAKVIAVINFNDESLYIDLIFNLKKGQWDLTDFNERR